MLNDQRSPERIAELAVIAQHVARQIGAEFVFKPEWAETIRMVQGHRHDGMREAELEPAS